MKTRGRGPASQPQREAKLIISKLYPACFLKKKKKKGIKCKRHSRKSCEISEIIAMLKERGANGLATQAKLLLVPSVER